MFQAVTTYLVGRKIVTTIVLIAMMIGLLAVCLVAYAFVPSTSDGSNTSESHTVISETNVVNSAKTIYPVPTGTVFLNSAG